MFLAGAVALAAAVLIVTMLVGPARDPRRPGGLLNETPRPTVGGRGGEFGKLIDQWGTNWYFDALNKRGQLTQIWGKTLSPLPQGQALVTLPVLRMHLAGGVMEIRSQEATFDAPNNMLRRGEFRKQVIMTFFAAGPAAAGRQPNMRADSADARFRLFLDNAQFDMEIGQIDSAGPVHLTSAKLDFTGDGLDLSYNDARHRINHLSVMRGKELRIAQQRSGQGETGRPSGSSAATNIGDKSADYYRATLAQDVKVHDRASDFAGDALTLFFSPEEKSIGQLTDGASSGTAPAPFPADGAGTAQRAATQPANPLIDQPVPQPLFHAAESDLIATWAGPLTVEPLDQKPADLAGPDDRLLVMTGRPVRIVNQAAPAPGLAPGTPVPHELITAATARYLASADLIDLQGDVRVDSDRFGNLRGPRVVLNQRDGAGQVIGAGTLLAHAQMLGDFVVAAPDAADGSTTRAVAMPGPPASTKPAADVTIAWNDGCEWTFSPKAQGPSTGTLPASRRAEDFGRSTQLAALKTARFRGDVKVAHPQFDLAGQTIDLTLDPPAPGLKPGLKTLVATGNAAMHGHGAATRGNFDVQAPTYTIDFVRNSLGEVEPRHFLAQNLGQGKIQARQPDQSITAGKTLDVKFYNPRLEPGTETRPADPNHPLPALDVRTMLAQGDVHIDQTPAATGPGSHITAETANFDALTGLADLTGTEGSPVTVSQPDGTLAGGHVILHRDGQRAEVEGPGALHVVRAAPQAADPAAEPFKPGYLDVVWKQRMSFDNKTGKAKFFGDVASDAQDGLATHHLTGKNELTIDFVPQPPQDAQTGARAAGGQTVQPGGVANLLHGPQQVLGVRAVGEATFQSESWADKPQGKVDTRLHLAGPAINFDNTPTAPQKAPRQVVWIDGPGKLLFEDYRPEPTATPDRPAAAPSAGTGRDVPGMSGSGRGKTLFTWTGKLNLDLFTNHVLMQDKVQMVHQPASSKDVLQLDSRQLAAQLSSTGGLEGWMGVRTPTAGPKTKAPQPTLESVNADGAVRATWTQEVIDADHMAYDGKTQQMVFTADPDRRVDVTDLANSLVQPAERLIWNLKEKRFVFDHPGATHAPPIQPKPRPNDGK